MKIANIILTSQNGGAEQVFVDYIKIFQQLNHQNFAIIKKDAPYFEQVESRVNDVLKINNNFGYYDLLAINKIKNFLIRNNINCIVAHGGRAMFLASKAIAKIKKNKIFLVSVNHSNNVKRSIGSDIIINVNKKIFYKTIDLKQPSSQTFVVHNALDFLEQKTNFKEIDLENKPQIIIGVIGRFHSSKGFDNAIKTLSLIKNSSLKNIFSKKMSEKKFILKIAGSGEELAYLKKLVKNYNLENEVEFLGWINKEQFFANIDIFLQTSLTETFGLVTLEAMNYRKPIICTDTDGSMEIIRDQVDGLIVKINDTKPQNLQFAEAIDKLINSNKLINNFVNSSYQRLIDKFSFNILKQTIRDIIGNNDDKKNN